MKIAILGWGSLIKEPRTLPIVGEWQSGGPIIWIEFSRISKRGEREGCLTLVIDEHVGSEVQSMYVQSRRTDVSSAISDLSEREGTSLEDIGFCEVAPSSFAPRALRRHPKSCERIKTWAMAKGFDSVVWTALGPHFKDKIGVQFTPEAALDYLNNLTEPTKEKALNYINNAPDQTITSFRRLFLSRQAQPSS